MVRLREARAVDVVKVTRYALPRFAGVVAENDNGETIGIGLILFLPGRRPMVTLDITDELRRFPRILARIGFTLVRAGVEACGTVYVMQDTREASSERWLTRLGFIPTDEVIAGEKVWKRSH